MVTIEIDGCSECDRDADIIKRVRTGYIGMCSRHMLAHEFLQRSRGLIRNKQDGSIVRWLGRALAYEVVHPEKSILEHADLDHVPIVKELLLKLESDRVYEPGESYDGTKQGGLAGFAEKSQGEAE